ncbi:hypothetical protein KM043_006620 [Ampulex compressa]|nr:hypothetical protein KM043_006620 [Ampulex compressa]
MREDAKLCGTFRPRCCSLVQEERRQEDDEQFVPRMPGVSVASAAPVDPPGDSFERLGRAYTTHARTLEEDPANGPTRVEAWYARFERESRTKVAGVY